MGNTQSLQCYACGKVVLVRKDGTLRKHLGYERAFPGAPYTEPCPGGGNRQNNE